MVHESGKTRGQEEEPIEYVSRQEKVESREKHHLAKYVIDDLQLKDGQGLVVDAGSTCLTVFEEYADRIRRKYMHVTFRTNNNLILKYWEQSEEPAIRETAVELLGSILDRSHQAYYGEIARISLQCDMFRPAGVIIGCSGLYFDPEEGIRFSYHGGTHERDFKHLLFQYPAIKKRFILATASKIGFAGAYSLDILKIPDRDDKVPICLLTTGPAQDDESTVQQFRQLRKVFHDKVMQDRIKFYAANLRFEWIVLDPATGRRIYDEFDRKVMPDEHGVRRTCEHSS